MWRCAGPPRGGRQCRGPIRVPASMPRPWFLLGIAIAGCLLQPCAPALSFSRGGKLPGPAAEGLLRLRGGHAGVALQTPPSGGAPLEGGADLHNRCTDEFDIDTLKPPSLPPLLRPRMHRRHGRAAPPAASVEAKSNTAEKPCDAPLAKAERERQSSAVAVAAAAAAAAAARAEALDDVLSHVSTSAGPTVLSRVSASTGAQLPVVKEASLLCAPFATVGGMARDLSGLVESQGGETTEDEEMKHDSAATPESKKAGTTVSVGDMLGGRFSLLGLLGAGAFGQVFLAADTAQGGHVAIKVQGAGTRQSQVAQDEIGLLNVVSKCRSHALSAGLSAGAECVVELKGSFTLRGAQGKQVCLALEPLGPSLLDLIIDFSYGGCPLPIVAHIMRDVLAGLDFLHKKCQIVHTDVKPENVLLCIPPTAAGGGSPSDWWESNREGRGGAKEGNTQRLRKGWSGSWPAPQSFRAKLVDLGNACPEARPLTDDIQTIEYRSPEVVLGAGFNAKADLWSAACMAFELITGEYLFDPQEGRDGQDKSVVYTREEDLLALQQELLGPLPLDLSSKGRYFTRLMKEDGGLRRIPSLKFWKLEDVLVDKYCVPHAQAREISDFLLPMLRYDPDARASAAEMLQHPWLLKHLERV